MISEEEFFAGHAESLTALSSLFTLADKVSNNLLTAMRHECEDWYQAYESMMDLDAFNPEQKRLVIQLQGLINDLIIYIDKQSHANLHSCQ